MIRRKTSRTGAALLLLLPYLALATIVPRLDLQQLARSSELIVHGRVLRHWSDWDRAHQFIWTHYLLQVTEPLKGRLSAAITVSEPGGAVAGTRMRVPSLPEYADGEEVVVFLERTPLGYWRCRGWGQGKYTVVAREGVKCIRTNLRGLAFADRPGASASGLSPLERLGGMEFGEFKRLVRKEAER